MNTQHANALGLPPRALKNPKAAEVLRAWVVDQGLQVSRVPGFAEPDVWGLLLVDIARHAARMYASEGVCSEVEALERIRKLWNAEITGPTDPGQMERHS